MQGVVIENVSNLFKVNTGKEIYDCNARGKLKQAEINPVVGDVVNIEIIDKVNKKAVIEKIQKRKVYVKRPKIANITQFVFVLSSENPKPDLLMLDKQIAFAEFLNIKSIIVLNKIDLDQNKEFENIKSVYEKIGYKVIKTEAKSGKGVIELLKYMNNNINVFAGNSGVGKSTLINRIFEKNVTQEGEVSKKNKKGKNTTTGVKLYEIAENTYIADTPGFSTFEINEIKSQELYKCFIEFNDENCKYIGCMHIKEQDCGTKKDVACGLINQGRYDRYCKIYKEIKEKESKKW